MRPRLRVRLPIGGLLVCGLLAASCGRQTGYDSEQAVVDSRAPGGGKTRVYYIAADVVTWDPLPGGIDQIAGARVSTPTTSSKAIYRRYTDSTFATLRPRLPEWRHLGLLGPAIRAEVGDTIRVVFRNNTDRPCNLHPHGLQYGKGSEGVRYEDGTSGDDKQDEAVPPGGTREYRWDVPERAGPGPGDGSSVGWMYYSDADGPADDRSALVGPIIVTARGKARPNGSPLDVDRELVTMFLASPDAYSINGFVRGGLPLDWVAMHVGERVRWYVMAPPGDAPAHAPHWRGNTVLLDGRTRADTLALPPLQMRTADMVPDVPGTWLFGCDVPDHRRAGMQVRYLVTPKPPFTD